MTERVSKTITSPDGKHRMLIVHRVDGAYSARRQWLVDSTEGPEWSQAGPYLGVYDSAETAEAEAFARISWPEAS
jgi:hypothetical protein